MNASRSSQNGLPEKMPDIDFIVTSGNTSMSRTNSPQKENGPFMYSCGKQGKYFLTLTLDIKESKTDSLRVCVFHIVIFITILYKYRLFLQNNVFF